jgi:predicted nucleotidyltransferase
LRMVAIQTHVPLNKITAFCKRWKVVEFALFGSAVREDFSAQSDIDVLVSFDVQSNWSLFDHVQMKNELAEIFGREVDLVTRRALEQSRNALLRSEILGTAKTLYLKHKPINV